MNDKLRQIAAGLEWRLQQQCEASATAPVSERVVAMDETFFQQYMILVMMDLSSGYILLEQTASDRSFDTWQAQTNERLKALGLTVRHAISDRAKALIKLATQGFGCASGADLFHGQYELSQWLSRPLGRATEQAAKHLDIVRSAFNRQQETIESDTLLEPEATHLCRVAVTQAEQAHQQCVEAQQAYRQHQQAISDIVHPFDPATNQPQNAKTVKTALQKETAALKVLAEERGIDDKENRLAAFTKQHDDFSVHVSVWWQWIETLLKTDAPEADLSHWITHQLMPTVYWYHQCNRTKKAGKRHLYQRAWGNALTAFEQHTFTQSLSKEQITYWQQWCEDKVPYFQRTSSAVEGRNGGLSQLYHNGRGLTERRLTALTVIHNYAIRRPDGSTPASRLFGQEFPDVFEWLLSEMSTLPLLRRKRKCKATNALICKNFPGLCG